MTLPSFDALYQSADAMSQPVPIACVGAADATVIEALRIARDRGWIVPTAVGRKPEIVDTADRMGASLDGFRIIDTDQPAEAAVNEIRTGRACLLMKGQISTPNLMQAVLHPQHGLRTNRVICQVVLMEIVSSQRRFLMADTGICIRPSFDQKLDILRSAVEVAQQLDADVPRVALMAATETVTDAMPDTHEAARIGLMSQRGELGSCVAQGPLSFDLAYAADAAEKKRVAGPVTGAADIMIFPDLVSANLTVKAIMYTADCRFGGVLWGARCPIVFMSRSDSTETRLNSIAMAVRLYCAAGSNH